MNTQDKILYELGEIKGELKGINQRLDRVNGRIDDHDDKINALEGFKDEIIGGEKQKIKTASLGGALAGGFVTAIIWLASKLFK